MRNTVVPQSGVVLVAALAAVQVTAEVTYKDAVYIELPVNAADATVTGVACEVRSKTPAALEPHFCWTYDGGGTERQSVWFNNSYAI
jgi:hypothetical protein